MRSVYVDGVSCKQNILFDKPCLFCASLLFVSFSLELAVNEISAVSASPHV